VRSNGAHLLVVRLAGVLSSGAGTPSVGWLKEALGTPPNAITLKFTDIVVSVGILSICFRLAFGKRVACTEILGLLARVSCRRRMMIAFTFW